MALGAAALLQGTSPFTLLDCTTEWVYVLVQALLRYCNSKSAGNNPAVETQPESAHNDSTMETQRAAMPSAEGHRLPTEEGHSQCFVAPLEVCSLRMDLYHIAIKPASWQSTSANEYISAASQRKGKGRGKGKEKSHVPGASEQIAFNLPSWPSGTPLTYSADTSSQSHNSSSNPSATLAIPPNAPAPNPQASSSSRSQGPESLAENTFASIMSFFSTGMDRLLVSVQQSNQYS